MNPMNEAWALLKANPVYQANLQGTNQPGAGGSIPQQFMLKPGYSPSYEVSANPNRPAEPKELVNIGGYQFSNDKPPGGAGEARRYTDDFERQQHPPVGRERSFQSLQNMPGQEEAEISRQPKQGLLQRRRDKKQQRLAQRAEKTGKGKDYRAAYPIDASQGSVFEAR